MLACEAIVGAVLPVSCARRVVVLIFLLPVLLIWFLARQRIDHWTKLPFVQRQCGAVSWLPYPHPYHRRLRRWIPNPTFRKEDFCYFRLCCAVCGWKEVEMKTKK